MKGICHPDGDREGLAELGLGWVRMDIPYPYDSEGNETGAFLGYKNACAYYAEKGIFTVGITPYPSAFIAAGIDIRTPEGLKEAENVCARVAFALKDSVKCWQVTNEMHVAHFRAPLTSEESWDFLIACSKGLRLGDQNACIGHNSYCGEWIDKLVEIEDAIGGSDYIGLDCYAGTWGDGDVDTYAEEINKLYNALGIPVILMEFGYSSNGKTFTAEEEETEINKFLLSHGFADREDAKQRYEELAQYVPPVLARIAAGCSAEDKPMYILNAMTHILKYWRYDGGFSHTEKGQADFYSALLPKLLENPYLGGAILYCWKDSPSCFTCGQSDCPCETAWGLSRVDGTRKPAYYVVKKIFGE